MRLDQRPHHSERQGDRVWFALHLRRQSPSGHRRLPGGRLKDGVWELRVDLGIDPLTGKRVQPPPGVPGWR